MNHVREHDPSLIIWHFKLVDPADDLYEICANNHKFGHLHELNKAEEIVHLMNNLEEQLRQQSLAKLLADIYSESLNAH